jgi:hypothetical protein
MAAAWSDWIEWEQGFQKTNLDAIAKYPLSQHRPISPHAMGSISRAYYDPQRKSMIAAFRYPGVAAYVGTMSLEDGSIKPLVDVKGPILYKVTSLPTTRTARGVLHPPTTRLLSWHRLAGPRDRHLHAAEDARIGDWGVQPQRPVAVESAISTAS